MYTVFIDIENEDGSRSTWVSSEQQGVCWKYQHPSDAFIALEDMGETMCWIEFQGRTWSCLFKAEAVAGAVSR